MPYPNDFLYLPVVRILLLWQPRFKNFQAISCPIRIKRVPILSVQPGMAARAECLQIINIIRAAISSLGPMMRHRRTCPTNFTDRMIGQELITHDAPLCIVPTLSSSPAPRVLRAPMLSQVLAAVAHIPPVHQADAPPMATWSAGVGRHLTSRTAGGGMSTEIPRRHTITNACRFNASGIVLSHACSNTALAMGCCIPSSRLPDQ